MAKTYSDGDHGPNKSGDMHALFGLHQYHPYIHTGEGGDKPIHRIRADWSGAGRAAFVSHLQTLFDERDPHAVALWAFQNESNIVVSDWHTLRAFYHELDAFIAENSSEMHPTTIRSASRIRKLLYDAGTAYGEATDAHWDNVEQKYRNRIGTLAPRPVTDIDEPVTFEEPGMAHPRRIQRESAESSSITRFYEVA